MDKDYTSCLESATLVSLFLPCVLLYCNYVLDAMHNGTISKV